MKLLAFVILASLSGAGMATSQDLSSCTSIRDGIGRLACYDKVSGFVVGAPAPAAAVDTLHWSVLESTSPIDDSKNVIIRTSSKAGIVDQHGQRTNMTLAMACRENTTSMWIDFGGLFMSDIQGFGDLTFRVDTRKAQTKGLTASTDHKALGLWNGGSAIPFAKSLFEGEKLYVAATPYGESQVSDTFDVSGLEKVIEPLRAACRW